MKNQVFSMDLESLFNIPLNRISQYQREMEAIRDQTNEKDIDYVPLKNMIAEMLSVKEYVTISKPFTVISEIEKKIFGLKDTLCKNSFISSNSTLDFHPIHFTSKQVHLIVT